MELNQAIDRDDLQPGEVRILLQEIAALRAQAIRQRNLNATLTGAASAVLNAIHRAGGYHVEAAHRVRIQQAIQALEMAVITNLGALNQPIETTPCA